jgi:hypothetical protein
MTTNDRAPCPDIGVWRAWLDHEDVTAHRFARAVDTGREPPSIEDHLSDCPACRRLVAELREDASDVRDILSILAPTRLPSAAEVAVARERLDWRRASTPRLPQPQNIRRLEPIPMFLFRLSTPWRFAASGLAAAVLVTLLVAFTPQGGSVAAAFLSQFRSQQVTAIGITPQSQAEITRTLNALGNLGTIKGPGVNSANGAPKPEAVAKNAEGQVKTVTQAEASKAVHIDLLTPDPAKLPPGVDKTPQVRVTPESQIQFTFDKKKATAYFQSTGHPEVSLPDEYDGATLTVTIPSAVILEYGDTKSRSGLIIAEANEVVAEVQGKVSLPEMRDFLLGLPGLPPGVVSQLKGIQSWNDTLPIPVPVDQVHWDAATIKGGPGLLLRDNSGVGSAAIWHADHHLYGVAGSIKYDDLQRLVDSMAVR